MMFPGIELLIASLVASLLLAEPAGGQPRPLCADDDPASRCPGADCRCLDDVLLIEFTESGAPVLDLGGPPFEEPIEVTIFLDTKSEYIQDWSYGVRHDRTLLSLQSVTHAGTAAAAHFMSGFFLTTFLDVADCTTAPPCLPGGGFISAMIQGFAGNAVLPVGRNSLARARYLAAEALAEAGAAGTRIEFSQRLKFRNSPEVDINITVGGKSRLPRTVVDGWLKGSTLFRRGDANADGRLDITDAIETLLFLHLLGKALPCLEAADFDGDGRLDTADAISSLRWLFRLGVAPASPGPPPLPCGLDPRDSPANLGCSAYEGC